MKIKQAILLVTLCVPLGCIAQNEAPSIAEPDCASWIESNSLTQRAWAMGYLSGLNASHAHHKLPTSELTTAENAALWVTHYCQQNPTKQVSDGVDDLFDKLMIKAKKNKHK